MKGTTRGTGAWARGGVLSGLPALPGLPEAGLALSRLSGSLIPGPWGRAATSPLPLLC